MKHACPIEICSRPFSSLRFECAAPTMRRSIMEQETLELPLNDRLSIWFEANRKKLVIGAVVAIAATFVILFYLDSQHKKQVTAGEALARALMTEYQTSGRVASPDGMLKVASEKSGTQAGAQAVLLAGGALFTQGKFAESQSQFERLLKEYPGNQFGPQALLGVASSLHAQGKLDQALTAYKNAERPGSSTATQAKFGQASILAAQGKGSEAMALYEAIFMDLREDRSNPLGAEAAMRAIELRAKLPAPSVTMDGPVTAPLKLLSATNNPAAK